MNIAPIAKKAGIFRKDQGINTNWLSKYRPRMKDLRRPAFCPAAKPKPRAGVPEFQGMAADRSALAMAALQGLLRCPPCGATGIAGILRLSRSALGPHETTRFNGEPHEPSRQRPRHQGGKISP
jgi:hypothetical protein